MINGCGKHGIAIPTKNHDLGPVQTGPSPKGTKHQRSRHRRPSDAGVVGASQGPRRRHGIPWRHVLLEMGELQATEKCFFWKTTRKFQWILKMEGN